jgi:hypothetical protein
VHFESLSAIKHVFATDLEKFCLGNAYKREYLPIFMALPKKNDETVKKNGAGKTNNTEPRQMSIRRAIFIASLVTLSGIFTFYLPDQLPADSGSIFNAQTGYDFFRFLGGTFVGALLALLGSGELAEKLRVPR